MKKAIQLLFTAFTFLTVVSCQKELFFPVEKGPVVPALPGRGPLLSKCYGINYNGAVADTFNGLDIVYDSLWRVHQINTYIYNQVWGPLFSVATFYYNGNDSNASKSIELFNNFTPGHDRRTAFFYYDSKHRLVKDSVEDDANTITVSQYEYRQSMITSHRIYQFADSTFANHVQLDTGYINNTGNIRRITTTWVSMVASDSYDIDYSYDDKHNPFFNLNIHTTFDPLSTKEEDFPLFLSAKRMQKNNLLHRTLLFSDPLTDELSYSYLPNDYPQTQNLLMFRNGVVNMVIAFIYL